MGDSDPRVELLAKAITRGDDVTALELVGRGADGVDMNGAWNGRTHLYRASWRNRAAVVARLLELGADADKTGPGYETPLGVAARCGHFGVIELLVEKGGANVNQLDERGALALHRAAQNGHVESAKYLVAHGSIDTEDSAGRTALHCARMFNHYELFQYFASLTLTNPCQKLATTVEFDDDKTMALSIIRTIAEEGVDVNVYADANGESSLYRATRFGRVAVVQGLLELGADVGRTANGTTCLCVAARNGHLAMLELLVKKGLARVNQRGNTGETALHGAAGTCDLRSAKFLVACGCPIDAVDCYGRTALNYARCACRSDFLIFKKFLESAAKLSSEKDYRGLLKLCNRNTTYYFLKLKGNELRYAVILAVRYGRKVMDDKDEEGAMIDPFLKKLAQVPSADSRTPNTEGQVLRHILRFVGVGFV
jgi:ankyrin repeat protein